jgi:hypothetical protein
MHCGTNPVAKAFGRGTRQFYRRIWRQRFTLPYLGRPAEPIGAERAAELGGDVPVASASRTPCDAAQAGRGKLEAPPRPSASASVLAAAVGARSLLAIETTGCQRFRGRKPDTSDA